MSYDVYPQHTETQKKSVAGDSPKPLGTNTGHTAAVSVTANKS